MEIKQEIWKDIPDYEGIYKISNLGNIKRILKSGREKIKKQTIANTGYYYIQLSNNGKNKVYQVHQLVAVAFLNHKPCGFKLVVDHINNIKTDNSVENLQILSHRKNVSKTKNKTLSKYAGVTWHKVAEKWVCQIEINKKREYLGLFPNEEAAKNAYDNRLKEHFNKL